MASGRPTVGTRSFRGSSFTCGSPWSAASSSCGGRLRPARLSKRRCPRRSSERRGRRTPGPCEASPLDSLGSWLRVLDGESQLSEHPDGAGLPALEIAGGKALASGELISCAQDRLRRVTALPP